MMLNSFTQILYYRFGDAEAVLRYTLALEWDTSSEQHLRTKTLISWVHTYETGFEVPWCGWTAIFHTSKCSPTIME